jgi:hypothetical protein
LEIDLDFILRSNKDAKMGNDDFIQAIAIGERD